MARDNEFECNQFCRLGEMMDDGLNYEPDGKWITKEYRRLALNPVPGIKEDEQKARKDKAAQIQQRMDEIIKARKCICGGILIQRRKGTTVCYCQQCNARYKLKKQKK